MQSEPAAPVCEARGAEHGEGAGQVECALADVVQQPAGSGHEDVDALLYLSGELAGGRQHEGTHGAVSDAGQPLCERRTRPAVPQGRERLRQSRSEAGHGSDAPWIQGTGFAISRTFTPMVPTLALSIRKRTAISPTIRR